jgi:hypothetical protein
MAIPVNEGSTPIASIAFLPRLGWTMSRVYLPVRAQCTQASFPSTRNPVSSNPAAWLAAIRSRTRSQEAGTPNSSQRLRGALLGQELADV